MIIHNVMEDLIYTEVNKLFDEAEKQNTDNAVCTCMQCRRDVMCYVLNRVKPRYIKSGRGLAHFLKFEKEEKAQIITDITALAMEGMQRVFKTKRPHESDIDDIDIEEITGSAFNFPAITGKILNGRTFKPMESVVVTLRHNNEIVKQTNILWDNPYKISDKTPGIFTFCPKSIAASEDELDKEKKFVFVITASKEGFETGNFSFELNLIPDKEKKTALSSSDFYKLKDFHLFDKNSNNET